MIDPPAKEPEKPKSRLPAPKQRQRKDSQPKRRPHKEPPTPAPKQSLRIVIFEILFALAAIAGIVSVGTTVLEKWHDTIAVIDLSGDVDPEKPFTLPLNVKNPSSIFEMHYPTVSCKFSATYSDGGTGNVTSNGGTYGLHRSPLIPAGGSAPFFCDFPDKLKITSDDTKKLLPLTEGGMTVSAEYETWVPWTVNRKPPPAVFALLKTSVGFRWIKGTQIK
jgi:hypothetical protein